MASLDVGLLSSYEGHSIGDICPHGFDKSSSNHCAHFVAHVLALDFGVTCAQLTGNRGAREAANVRVQEIFARCPNTRELDMCPQRGRALIFVSRATNFEGSPTRLRNVPKKHIGIFLDGRIWHYSNTRNRVVVQQVPQFLHHYPRQANALWFGDLPATARPRSRATCSP